MTDIVSSVNFVLIRQPRCSRFTRGKAHRLDASWASLRFVPNVLIPRRPADIITRRRLYALFPAAVRSLIALGSSPCYSAR